MSKPPSPVAARAVVEAAGATPTVAALVGLAESEAIGGATAVARTFEGGVRAVFAALGVPVPEDGGRLRQDIEQALVGLDPTRTVVRGVYSGGTLCYEALTVLEPWLGPVWSNTPLDKRHRVPAPPGAHVCLDLGEEEYTSGRPHPMIDPEARLEVLRDVAEEPDVAVVLLDVVLGYGSHPDPAALLAPACAAPGRGRRPAVGRLRARDRRRSAGPLPAAGRVPGGRRPRGSDGRARRPGRRRRRAARRGHRGQFPPVTDPAP